MVELDEYQEGDFLCEVCETLYKEGGDCPRCPEEPLLDLRNEDVQELIRSLDRQRFYKRAGQVLGAVIALMVVTSGMLIGIMYFTPGLDDVLERTLEFMFGTELGAYAFGTVLLGFIFIVLSLEGLGMRMFPPKQLGLLIGDDHMRLEDNRGRMMDLLD